MTTNTFALTAREPVAAVCGVLIAMALTGSPFRVMAQAQDADAVTRPTSTVEVGPGNVSQRSYKAGEYNGLQAKGAFGVGNFDLRGGGSYDSESALRWRIKGTDLGVDTRNVFAEIGAQGTFRLTVGFDQLRRNRSDTYQTPYTGTGTNMLTLPGAWLVPTVAGTGGTNPINARGLVTAIGNAPFISTAAADNGAIVGPTAAQAALVNAAAAADVPLFHTVDLFTKRTRFDAVFNYSFDPKWGIDASFRPEHKDGLKPMGTVSRNTGGDISTIIADRIDTDHDQVNVSLNFKGTKSFAQAGYYGSFFNNHVPSMSWQNWATPSGTLNTIGSTPSNRFNQVNAGGGIRFTASTKLVVSGSYGQARQDDAFLTDSTTPVVPVTSLNGLVTTTAFNTKLTARPAKKLSLTGAYKFDNRDNRTPIHIYQYADAGEAPAPNANFPAAASNPYGPVLAQNANANRPYSRKLNQVDVDADYAVVKGQWIKAGYDFEKISRACTGSWMNCADAATTNEQTLRAEWRLNASESVNARVDYAYSARRTPNYDENAFLALVPYAGVSPATATDGATALSFMNTNGWTGYGPAAGFTATTGNMNLFFPSSNALANAMYANNNRISELPGMRRYYVADRNRDKVRTLLSWQVSEPLSLQGGVDLSNDHYPDSRYGLQDAKGWAVDLDGTYALGEDMSVNVFYTYENQRSVTASNSYTANSNTAAIANGQPGVVGLSGNGCDGYTTLQQRNNNNKVDPCLDWSSAMLDKANTVGLGLRRKLALLDLTGDLVFSRARWDNNVSGGNWANNIGNGPGAPPTAIAAFFIPAIAWPAVTTDTTELRLSAKYTVNAHSVRVGYSYMRMRSADPTYEGMQIGSVSTLLPSSEQPFRYGVSLVGVSYILSF
jgi:MtrB/PioB family decaheme-associated outer membrane protein